MILRCRGRSAVRKDDGEAWPSCCASPRSAGLASLADLLPRNCWSSKMKWETPQATDLRFGMEITMYIANR